MPGSARNEKYFLARISQLLAKPRSRPNAPGEWSALGAVDPGAHTVTLIGLDRGRAAGEGREQNDGAKD